MTVCFGGNVSVNSVDFIVGMTGFADRFETRKVVFKHSTDKNELKQGILKALEFEMLYIQNKCEFYDRMANEDRARLDALKERLVREQNK